MKANVEAIINAERCIIGESPIWNEKKKVLYYTNGGGKELCMYFPYTGDFNSVPLEKDCAAFAFDCTGNLIASRDDGVFRIDCSGKISEIYSREIYEIKHANDMKAGPDGRIYVGTQSEQRLGISDKIDGKLYSVDKFGNVKVLLDGLRLSNGMEWSLDEKFFYHTDSDTSVIREYTFDSVNGEITFSGREIFVQGVDGFTIGEDGRLYAACWGRGHIAVINTADMLVEEHIDIPCAIPASCAFAGNDMEFLAVTTASFGADTEKDKLCGYAFLLNTGIKGRKPYLFG